MFVRIPRLLKEQRNINSDYLFPQEFDKTITSLKIIKKKYALRTL